MITSIGHCRQSGTRMVVRHLPKEEVCRFPESGEEAFSFRLEFGDLDQL